MSERQRILHDGLEGRGPVVYWMRRDFRAQHNWALLWGQKLAQERSCPLVVLVARPALSQVLTARHSQFFVAGLQALAVELEEYNIPLVVLPERAEVSVVQWLKEQDAAVVVTDFQPLRPAREELSVVAARIASPIYEVDAHNIVPCWLASDKQEYGAYTLRPKLHKLLPRYLTKIPAIAACQLDTGDYWPLNDWEMLERAWTDDAGVAPVGLPAGAAAGWQQAERFFMLHLPHYLERNDPAVDRQSQLSPYLHFGQVSAQMIAFTMLSQHGVTEASQSFLEELVVRRELADNYCYYNEQYDEFNGLPAWGQQTLLEHADDPREYLYSRTQLAEGATHDPYWNAAQQELVKTGKMHGYMRMYWAKKILEWQQQPEEALQTANYLNDQYALDGSDPNGYAGVAWSVGGVHDRAWPERAVFGKIRYMNAAGLTRKFAMAEYLARIGCL